MSQSRQPTHHGYAVNVKDHGRYDYDDALSDTEAQQVYDAVAEGFWLDADLIAQEYGFDGCYSDGRSGGWAVPHPQPRVDDMYERELDEWLAKMFRPFEAAILECMQDYQSEACAALAEAARLAKAEPTEAAYWAARDVVTL